MLQTTVLLEPEDLNNEEENPKTNRCIIFSVSRLQLTFAV